MTEKKPTVFLIVGPNGAGKSTLYDTVIKPKINAPFINADIIQKEEMKDPSMQASYKAALIAGRRRAAHFKEKKSFATETVFSHSSKLDLIDKAKSAGFRTVLYHVNVRSPNLSVARVDTRVKEGGHPVPEEKIRARYERNQPLILEAARKSDRAFIYDNSQLNKAMSLQIVLEKGRAVHIANNVVAWARELYAAELEPYSLMRQNAAAESYRQIKTAAQAREEKPDIEVKIPQRGQSYAGHIVSESSKHVLQETGRGDYVAHFKTGLKALSYKLGENIEVKYDKRLRPQAQKLEQNTERNTTALIKNPQRRNDALALLVKVQSPRVVKSQSKDFGPEQ